VIVGGQKGHLEQGDGERETADGFSRRREQSRRRIREAAFDLFSQFGVGKVSVTDVARKAGLSPATIYNNFGSKDALAREFVVTVIGQLVRRAEDVLRPERPYTEKMAAFVDFISRTLARESRSAVTRAVFASSLDLQNDPEIRKIRDSAQTETANLLLGLVQEGREQGQVDPNLSVEALRVYFRAFMDIFTDPELQHRLATDPKLAGDLGSLMVHGLRGHREETGPQQTRRTADWPA
jgi:AcrR family transcriptional regulator